MSVVGLRVLVVEDEALVAMALEDFLAELGCNVVATAARLEEALQAARTAAVDVAVLDINLAGRLSYPVAEILSTRGIPFIFATGYGAAGVPPAWSTAPVLPKPFHQRDLDAMLHLATAARPGSAP